MLSASNKIVERIRALQESPHLSSSALELLEDVSEETARWKLIGRLATMQSEELSRQMRILDNAESGGKILNGEYSSKGLNGEASSKTNAESSNQTKCKKTKSQKEEKKEKEEKDNDSERRNGAEEKGEIRKGATLVEATSGNTGISLAAIGAAKGYPVLIILPKNMTQCYTKQKLGNPM